MAVTTSTASNPLVTTIVTDADSDTTVEQAAGASQYLYFVEIANTNTVAVYTKLIDANSGTTSTQHYIQLYCPANTTCYFYVPASVAIANGIMVYTSTAGGVGSQTSPTNDVVVKIGITAQ
tara:strand:+ start:6681 stop:7043 length:363 start_codon:yes stop_codon:yes gene_type:complete